MATVKYFVIEDDTAILFGANGTALTAALAAIAGMISDIKFSLPIYPLWFYFLGLIFAFVSKSIIALVNSDTRERERSQSVRDFLMEVRSDPNTPDDFMPEWDKLWSQMEAQRRLLLTPEFAQRLPYWRAYSFWASAFCFLVGTASIIIFVGSKTNSL
ncbi:hypothetical protein C8J38_101456 [Rhizobium sp. PP-WC-2G-219]|nr:hypothetical protein C8J38_101456 [Rhizobium sp. PP-WC-2G-219]